MRKRKIHRFIHYFNAVRFYIPDMDSNSLFNISRIICSISHKEAKGIVIKFVENMTEEQKKLALAVPPKVLARTYNYLKDKEYI